MLASTDHVLTTHTGSLPRPDDLAVVLLAKARRVPVEEGAFQEQVRAATENVVRRQVELGIDVVSDGEMARNNFIDYIMERLTGFTTAALDEAGGSYWSSYFVDLEEFPELVEATYGETVFTTVECTGHIGPATLENVARDLDRFKAALEKTSATGAFMTAVSPGVVARSFPNKHYRNYEDYVMAVAQALRGEYRAITDAGVVLQLDAPDIGTCGDLRTWIWPEIERRGIGWVQDLHVEAMNVALEGIPPEHVRLHICWANYQGPHTHDLPLLEALEPALRANVGAIGFEAANPAHAHEWEVFEEFRLPDDKVIVPGVIDTKTQVVENPRLVAQRIIRYAELVGQERVIAGTDCGFGTAVGAQMVHPKVAWLKLKALAEGAAIASDALAKP